MSIKNNILAAKLNLEYDHDRMAKEIFNCSKHWRYSPPYKFQIENPMNEKFNLASKEDYDTMVPWSPEEFQNFKTSKNKNYIFYLRKNDETQTQSYLVTKPIINSKWQWREDLDIPYTKAFIDSLPFTTLGLIRVFVFKDTFLPVHSDWQHDNKITGCLTPSSDYDKCLGLSLIPKTGEVPMQIWSNPHNKVVEVPGNAMLFNDSVYHGVPKTTGYRITMRIFGEIDYEFFKDKIDNDHAYYNATT